jgi:hypothetical protein
MEITIRGIKIVGSSGPRYSKEEFRRRGEEIYAKIKDRVDPGNKGKILAIDIETGEYEVDQDKMQAVDRLFDRIDDPQIVCYRIGYNAVTTLGGSLKEIT